MKIVLLVLWLCAVCFSSVRWLHMLQLNSYRAKTQFRRFKETPDKLFCLLPVLGAVVFSLFGALWADIVCAVFLAISCLTLFPRKAKKPLVYTGRVKRMIATACVLYALTAVGGYWVPLIPMLALLVSPCMIMLANLCNAPIESSVRKWYINDAVKKLKASPDLLLLGVTGSYGKTSVKSYLGQLLSVKFDTLITPESFNTPMGVVRTVREHLRPTHEVFVCEMGARHVGDIKELCDLVHPMHGLITAIGEQHLETFKTRRNIINTKYELASSLPENGKLFLNGDCETIMQNLPSRPYITYGLGAHNHYRASDVSVSLAGTEFTVTAPNGESERYRMRLIGGHSVFNVTGAIAVCHAFGIPLSSLQTAVRKLAPVEHRMQLLPGEITYIDDAYNSNPAGCKAALETLGMFDACKILVTPGMVELGDAMDACNETFGRQAAHVCDLCVLVGEKQAVPIKRGLLAEGYPEERIRVVHTLQEGLAQARAFYSDKKKIVLLENDLPDNY